MTQEPPFIDTPPYADPFDPANQGLKDPIAGIIPPISPPYADPFNPANQGLKDPVAGVMVPISPPYADPFDPANQGLKDPIAGVPVPISPPYEDKFDPVNQGTVVFNAPSNDAQPARAFSTGKTVRPVPSSSPLERINIAGMTVLINPETVTYTINTRAQAIETQGGVIYQIGPEKPVELAWNGKTTKDSLGTMNRLKDIWRAQQYGRESIRYVNPMREEDYEVIILRVSYVESYEKPWRFDYDISFSILQDLTDPTLTASNADEYKIGKGDLNSTKALVSQSTTKINVQQGETFSSISRKLYGSVAFAGEIRSYVAKTNPQFVSPTGEPIPGCTITVPILTETMFNQTSAAEYFDKKEGTVAREQKAKKALTPKTSDPEIEEPVPAFPDYARWGWYGG